MLNKIDKRRCEICNIPCFERNNYFCGKMMTSRDFQDEQCYFNEKRWLMNRTVHGWGVVCGLDVIPTENKKGVEVTPGLAIDCCGREILVCGDAEDRYVPLIYDEIPKPHECDQPQSKEESGIKHIAVCLEYDECKREVVNLHSFVCDETEKHEFNRIRDSWKITPISIPQEFPDEPLPFCQRTNEEKEQSLDSYLCEKITKGCQHCPECPCIILAVVTVYENGNVKDEDIDTCNYRKLVYNNQLLFDQISCYHGDLPRVTAIEWSNRPFTPISDQTDQMVEKQGSNTEIHNQTIEWDNFVKKNGLIVTFNKIMDPGSINEHTFLIAIITIEHSTRYRLLKYIPSETIEIDNDDETTRVIFKFEKTWIEDELEDEKRSAITQSSEGADFEIILRGSSIFSEEGKALDGSFSGEFPSGNGTQGTDFVSWFHVIPPEQNL
jgi:hypothetical protein